MQNIWDIYKFIAFVTDKYRSGYVTPDEASLALSAAQDEVVEACWREIYGKTQTGSEALSALTLSSTAALPAGGVVPYPADYSHLLYLKAPGVKDFRQVLGSELNEALNSRLEPIEQYARYEFTSAGIKLYGVPAGTDVSLAYLVKPVAPKIGFTVDASGENIYNPASSQELMVSQSMWREVIKLALPYVAVNLSDRELMALTFQTPQS